MRVVGYLRVSTDRQAESGWGLDVQRAEIMVWAAREGHHIVSWERDEGVSGSNGLDTRVGLYGALGAIQDGSADGVVVHRLDRLARDLVLQETLLGTVWKYGGSVFSTVAGEAAYLDPEREQDDPSRRLSRQILGAVAEYERATIRLRLRAGKLAKKAQGGYIGGKVPFGFDLGPSGDLEPNQEEQRTIARMQELRDEGATMQRICDVLTEEGYQTKGGGRWQTATVGRILRRTSES